MNLSHCWNETETGKQRRRKRRNIQGQRDKSQHHNETISVVGGFFLIVGFFSLNFQMASLPQLWGSAYLSWNCLVALIHERLILPSSEIKHRFSLHRWTRRDKEDRMPLQEDVSHRANGWEFTKYFLQSSLSFPSPHPVFTVPLLVDLQTLSLLSSLCQVQCLCSVPWRSIRLCLEILPVLKASAPSGERKWAAKFPVCVLAKKVVRLCYICIWDPQSECGSLLITGLYIRSNLFSWEVNPTYVQLYSKMDSLCLSDVAFALDSLQKNKFSS